MMLGAYFRYSCLCFTVPYWYLFLLDKSAWNNHSYLYGLFSVMFLFSNAHHCWYVLNITKGLIESYRIRLKHNVKYMVLAD